MGLEKFQTVRAPSPKVLDGIMIFTFKANNFFIFFILCSKIILKHRVIIIIFYYCYQELVHFFPSIATYIQPF